MKVNCLHGYFIFEETQSGQVSDFMSLFGLSLVRKDNYFIFEDLEDAPDYSIEGEDYLGATATVTYAGTPWEVMRANGLVYNFSTGLVVPLLSITKMVQISSAGNFLIASGLILPGAVTDDGSRVTDYSAFFIKDGLRFKYSEVTYA